MSNKILILGGYGNFGGRIAARLAEDPALQVIIAGRSETKCRAFAAKHANMLWRKMDVTTELAAALADIKPQTVIHTCGPFQGQDYAVAVTCIEAGCNYIDLADGRDFVSGIGALDARAKEKGVTVISGASSVPCFSAAVIDHFRPAFGSITAIDYAISTAQRNPPGIATTAGVLGYAGKPFKTLVDGRMQEVYGWQSLQSHTFPLLGRRFLGNCDIPDLALFPQRYPELQSLRFYAGTELAAPQIGLWMLSGLVRAGLVKSLAAYANLLTRMARWFDVFGSERSGFYMTLDGTSPGGQRKRESFCLIAKEGRGPIVPCIPSILLARMLSRSELKKPGALPCLGLVTLRQYLDELQAIDGHKGNIAVSGIK